MQKEYSAALVARMIAAQFPRWAGLPVRAVVPGGHDNRTFRLGDAMSVRIPSAARYVAAVEKEAKWLPLLKPHLPLPIPAPLALGAPQEGCPYPWSVLEWIDGAPVSRETIADQDALARDLAAFLRALYAIDPADGPLAGEHNFYRGGDLSVYDEETRKCLAALPSRADAEKAARLWRLALASRWQNRPVWVHGDVAVGNLLARGGKLCGVVDFGSSGVGDPACDLVMAWTFFGDASRRAFRDAMAMDEDTWLRARGWALWKALITDTPEARSILQTILRDTTTPS